MINKNTEVWIYSALAKIKSSPNYNENSIGEVFEAAKFSLNNEVRQRAHEYSSRPVGIQNITGIEKYDANLTFLKDYIEAAIRKGAKKYDPSKMGVLGKLAVDTHIDSSLLTQHRQNDTPVPGTGDTKDAFDDVQLLNKNKNQIFGKKDESGNIINLNKDQKKAEPIKFIPGPTREDIAKQNSPTKPIDAKQQQRRAQAAKLFGNTTESANLFGNTTTTSEKKGPFGPGKTAAPSQKPAPIPAKPQQQTGGGNIFGLSDGSSMNKPKPVVANPQQTTDIFGDNDLFSEVSTNNNPPKVQQQAKPANDFDLFSMDFGGNNSQTTVQQQAKPNQMSTDIFGDNDL